MFNAFVANLSKDLVKWGIDKNCDPPLGGHAHAM
jgi:hypothetical protein